jgi:hypothetical protein
MHALELPVASYRFTLIAETPATLPAFPGPTLRGALGHTLRRLVCATRMPACAPCPFRFTCAYPLLFEPYASPDHPEAHRYARLPTPFTLEIPLELSATWEGREPPLRSFAPGEPLVFGMTLLGRAREHMPYYVHAIMEMARAGLGSSRQRFRLARAEIQTPNGPVALYEEDAGPLRHPPAPPTRLAPQELSAHRIAVRFTAPARLELQDDLVYPIEFHHLIRALLQRLRALQAGYGLLEGMELPNRLAEAAQAIRRVEDRTRWPDLRRYSTRQKTAMRIGGAVGTVIYESPQGFQPFALLLALGELLHVGKLTSMGFGRMEADPQ